MENFVYHIPTKVLFGKGVMKDLVGCIEEYGVSVMLVYGGGSIKRTGLYDKIKKQFAASNIEWCELSGVEPNPRLSTVKKGIGICKKGKAEVILAVGGGSSIDCAKAIAASVFYEGDPWELVEDGAKIKEVLPIIAIPTIAATGSEMDPFAVITKEETAEKRDLVSEKLYPAYAILDPENTYSVSPYQTACGTIDMISHVLEVYFCKVKDTFLQDRIMEGIMKTCIHDGPIAYRQPENYEARANLMWASEWAINGLISCGKSGPWPAHAIEHQLSACYDVTHGHGLAIVIPILMEYILKDESLERFVSYGINVWNIDANKTPMEIARESIQRTKEFIKEMGLTSLKDIKDTSRFEEMANKAVEEGLEDCLVPLEKKDILEIYHKVLEI